MGEGCRLPVEFCDQRGLRRRKGGGPGTDRDMRHGSRGARRRAVPDGVGDEVEAGIGNAVVFAPDLDRTVAAKKDALPAAAQPEALDRLLALPLAPQPSQRLIDGLHRNHGFGFDHCRPPMP